MNDKQKRFVAWYVATGGNGTQAAIHSGYSPKSARVTASKLLRKDEIKAAIEEELAKKYGYIPTSNEIIGFWSEIMRNPEEKTPNRLAASSHLAKVKGMFDPDLRDINWSD